MKDPTDWLLQGPAFVRYRTLIDLVGRPESDREVEAAYREMLADSLVVSLVRDINAWEKQYPITRHNDAVHPLHRLVFAAGIGIKGNELQEGIDAVLEHQSEQGPFKSASSFPRLSAATGSPGGTGWPQTRRSSFMRFCVSVSATRAS